MGFNLLGTFPIGPPIIYRPAYRGALSGFSYTRSSGIAPNAKYMVGFTHEAGNDALGSMRVNGVLIFDSYSAGNGNYRVTKGWSSVDTDSTGRLIWEGIGTQTVRANFELFAVRLE